MEVVLIKRWSHMILAMRRVHMMAQMAVYMWRRNGLRPSGTPCPWSHMLRRLSRLRSVRQISILRLVVFRIGRLRLMMAGVRPQTPRSVMVLISVTGRNNLLIRRRRVAVDMEMIQVLVLRGPM